MKKNTECRSNKREIIHQPVSFELNERGRGRPRTVMKSGVGVDVSSGGVGLTTAYPLKEGNVLKLYFPVAEGDVRLPVFSEVVWSKPTAGEFRAGLRFLA